ncbi:DUF2590 family protein [Hahella sp. CR1]|uniref:DUF2590 family protein n=1 Tax=Hahella sp. CR1 TaxID=2992807 RepID=UPI002442F56B|nr:DUF2590 family protein [Hahella sp. CR1]MDG9666723.1 DUF2590 family protein [Hahella sp. CR1]
MADFIDLHIVNNDISLDAIGVPQEISGRASIAQDIKHMIRESGLLVELIGERNPEKVALNLSRIETRVENDARIKPGTAKVTRTDPETVYITAKTLKYGHIEFYL